jgi:hypothetical protein
MPTIGHIGSIRTTIYYDDHGVPHFHAVSRDVDFKIAMADSSIISGNGHLRGSALAAIRALGGKAPRYAICQLAACP